MSAGASLRERLTALGVTPPFRAIGVRQCYGLPVTMVADTSRRSIALPFPDDPIDDGQCARLTSIIAEALNRALAAEEGRA